LRRRPEEEEQKDKRVEKENKANAK